ncbi:MAG: hypothetical protein K0Q68_592 [Moraxellaceae bacterium]|nr:hypothetical protein [Moraxellaceae bacterium]
MKPNATTLPEQGFIRLSTVLSLFPVSRSTWYAGVKKGIFPAPTLLGERTAAYRVEDIRALLASFGNAANDEGSANS